MIFYFHHFQSQTSSPGMKHELDDFDYVDVEGEDPGAPRVTKKELLEEGECFSLPFKII